MYKSWGELCQAHEKLELVLHKKELGFFGLILPPPPILTRAHRFKGYRSIILVYNYLNTTYSPPTFVDCPNWTHEVQAVSSITGLQFLWTSTFLDTWKGEITYCEHILK